MEIRASDAERDATVDLLREAAAEGQADARGALGPHRGRVRRGDALRPGRPQLRPARQDRGPGCGRQTPYVRALGDIKRAGAWSVPAENHFRTWFGNVKLDLRQAQISTTETDIHAWSLFGNVDLLVPEGVEVDVRTRTQIGRWWHQVAAPTPGAPRIVLTGGTFFGDVRIRRKRRGRSWCAVRRAG